MDDSSAEFVNPLDKEFIDKVRVRNRNLEVAVIREETDTKGL